MFHHPAHLILPVPAATAAVRRVPVEMYPVLPASKVRVSNF